MTRGHRLDQRSGFTLIELMVTLAIVSVLTYALMVGMANLKGRARDNSRLDQLEDLHHAIELYHTDNGVYPSSLSGVSYTTFLSMNDAVAATLPNPQVSDQYVPGLIPNYYQTLPVDPLPGLSTVPGCQALGYGRVFIYYSNGDHYKLISNCSSEATDYDPTGNFYDPGAPTSAWAVSDDMDYVTFTLGWM